MSVHLMPLTGLARQWVQRNLISEDIARSIQEESQKTKKSWISCLIQQQALNSFLLATTLAKDLGLPFFDLTHFQVDQKWVERLSVPLLFKHCVLPIMVKEGQLCLGVSDPTIEHGFNEIKALAHMPLQMWVVEDEKLTKILHQLSNHTTLHHAIIADSVDKNLAVEDAPVVRFVNTILNEAIQKRASDIHFEPYETHYRVRFRIDGLLYEMATPPLEFRDRLASRLKVMAKLDISERRLPQDGRFKLTTHPMDVRVSTCPTMFGEKIVLRLLNAEHTFFNLVDLGFEHEQKKLFFEALQREQGMILVTGPTGSGKTTTLYAALNELNTPHKNILTIEDPVEIYLKGINQVNTHEKVGLHFSTALRSFLRQDPDIMMVGEIRDLEAGSIAIKAAQTGHLVLSTVHTNSAVETLNRLLNMGLLPCDLATSITLIVAQRLVRRLCDHCKQKDKISELYYQASLQGCELCMKGYRGRIAIHEVLPITPILSGLLIQQTNTLELLEYAKKEGMMTLYDAGMMKVAQGSTSVEELQALS